MEQPLFLIFKQIILNLNFDIKFNSIQHWLIFGRGFENLEIF